jgi:hypothetical protein
VVNPPVWTSEDLDKERLRSIALFRSERLEEPLEDYLDAFDRYQGYVEDLLETTIDLAEFDDSALDILVDKKLREAFRYLAAPPISEDDLKILSEVRSFTKGSLRERPGDVQKVLAVVREVIDRRRFIWVAENREPEEHEKAAAVMASAALMAASRAQTNRRTLLKKRQEARVSASLSSLGLKEVRRRKIRTLAQAPGLGEFCGECSVAGRKADLVVRMWDDRAMPIECKVSNSALNSVKRLNNDAAVKAGIWKHKLGVDQVVPVAVLAGVYNLSNLLDAQSSGLTIFWAHDLGRLMEWISLTTQTVRSEREVRRSGS